MKNYKQEGILIERSKPRKGRIAVALIALVGGLALVPAANALVLIDGTTSGFYNDGIGTLLNGTGPVFPTSGDPVLDVIVEPDLSAAGSALADWLATPPDLSGGTWSATPVSVPTTWTVGTETAILYEIDAGGAGLDNVIASFGVDNGILVWLDGLFQGGFLRPGTASLGEHMFTLGDLSPGTHHLQILREDHGGGTGYATLVTGDVSQPVPEPVSMALFGIALAGLGLARRRNKQS